MTLQRLATALEELAFQRTEEEPLAVGYVLDPAGSWPQVAATLCAAHSSPLAEQPAVDAEGPVLPWVIVFFLEMADGRNHEVL